MAHQTKDPASGQYAPAIVQPLVEQLKSKPTHSEAAQRCPACGLMIEPDHMAGHAKNCNAKGDLD